MTVKNSIVWTTLLAISILTSSCSLLGTRLIETSSKPIEIDIIQPTMPRNIDLKDPKWHVVSSKTIANPCVKDEEGKRPKMDHPDGLLNDKGKVIRVCKLGKENNWPEGYTYLDKFIDDVKKQNSGDVVFFAITTEDYELMSYNMQELRRYIREVQEVVVYYRSVTINDKEGIAGEVTKK